MCVKWFEIVLEVNDLDVLGVFLDEMIGEFNVVEYIVNCDVV